MSIVLYYIVVNFILQLGPADCAKRLNLHRAFTPPSGVSNLRKAFPSACCLSLQCYLSACFLSFKNCCLNAAPSAGLHVFSTLSRTRHLGVKNPLCFHHPRPSTQDTRPLKVVFLGTPIEDSASGCQKPIMFLPSNA